MSKAHDPQKHPSHVAVATRSNMGRGKSRLKKHHTGRSVVRDTNGLQYILTAPGMRWCCMQPFLKSLGVVVARLCRL
jgi:hypothetical protein